MGKTVRHIEFPRYYSSFHGKIVGRYLNGEFGKINQVSPYLISLAYAMDRLTARKHIQDWLEAGYYVIADRYTSASLAHQTAKLPPSKRQEFMQWLEEMEYQHHKIPREDVVLFLYVPVEVSQELVAQRGKKDIQEANLKHQQEALKVYLKLAQEKKHWVKINCLSKDNRLLTKLQVHQLIMSALKEKRLI